MREIILGALLWLVTTLFQERAGKLAVILIHLEARLLPAAIRDEMRDNWLADLATVEGNISKFLYALTLCGNIPDIRAAYGEPLPLWQWANVALHCVNVVYLAVFMPLLILDIFFPKQLFGLLMQMLSVGTWLAFLLLPGAVIGMSEAMGRAAAGRRFMSVAMWLFLMIPAVFLTGAGLALPDLYQKSGRLDEMAIGANLILMMIAGMLIERREPARHGL